jgi:threonine dehydrogenase-like Zn-dependent dehydrogenase
MTMDRELICTAPHELEYREYTSPPLVAGQVRIRAEFGAAKHGTEMSWFKGYGNARGGYDSAAGVFTRVPASPYPSAVGNMVVGTVTEVGPGVTKLAAGDRALAYSGFRTTATAHERECWKLPEGLAWQSAVCIDPADFALGAVRDGHVRLGDAAAVFGLGAIGLMVVQALKLAGAAPIVAVDPIEARRQIALQLGAHVALDPYQCDAGLEIRKATGGRGADVVIEYSGARMAMQDALRGVAFGGTVVSGAYPPPHDEGLDLGAEAHINIPNIVFSRACSEPNRDYPRWDNSRIYAVCFELITSGRLGGEKIVWPVVSFDQLKDTYLRIADDPASVMKVGVRYDV